MKGKKGGTEPGNYDVGYGKPPTHSRFQPGQSGNPSGRPKQRGNNRLNSIIEKELFRPIRIKQDGHEERLPALQAAVRRNMIAAVNGNPRSLSAAVKLAAGLEGKNNGESTERIELTNEERVAGILGILDKARLRKIASEAASSRKTNSSSKKKRSKPIC